MGIFRDFVKFVRFVVQLRAWVVLECSTEAGGAILMLDEVGFHGVHRRRRFLGEQRRMSGERRFGASPLDVGHLDGFAQTRASFW